MKVDIVCCDEIEPLLGHLGNIFDVGRENFRAYLSDADAFIIQATVLVDTKEHTNWEGLKLIARLRQQFRCQQPILLTSWREDLLVDMQPCKSIKRLPERRIFLDPLVRFVPLSELISFTPSDLAGYFDPPLNRPEDCLSFDEMVRIVYEHPPSYIRELFHRLYTRLENSSGRFELEPAIDIVFDELLQLQQLLEEYPINVNQQLVKFRSKAEQVRQKDAFYRLLMQLYQQFSGPLHSSRTKAAEPAPPEKQHLLFVDDMAGDRARMTKILEPYHIIVHAVSDLEAAESCMARHPDICAVLCDFRLYDIYGRIARQQGRQIISVLSNQYPNLYFAYLSSYHFGSLDFPAGTRIELFHKHSIFSGEQPEFGRFIRRVSQKAAEKRAEFQYISLYLKKKPIGHYYQKYHSTDNFRAIRREVDARALEIFLDFRDRIHQRVGFGQNFQTRYNKKESEETQLGKLKLQLLCRTVIIGLLQLPLDYFDRYLGRKSSPTERRRARFETIYEYLLGDHARPDTHYKSKQDIYNNYLGIRTGKTYQFMQSPQETRELLFPEEWVWLQLNKKILIPGS